MNTFKRWIFEKTKKVRQLLLKLQKKNEMRNKERDITDIEDMKYS